MLKVIRSSNPNPINGNVSGQVLHDGLASVSAAAGTCREAAISWLQI